MQVVGPVWIGRKVAVEEMSALARPQLDGYAATAAGGNRGDDRKTAHNGGVAVGRGVKAKIGGDGLRRGAVAFLQADDVGAGGSDDFDAVAQAASAIHPDVKRQHFQLDDRRSLRAVRQTEESEQCD